MKVLSCHFLQVQGAQTATPKPKGATVEWINLLRGYILSVCQFISIHSIHLCTWIMMYICLLDVLLLYGVFSVCFYLAGGKKTSTAAVCRCNVTSTTSRMVLSSFQRLSSNNPYSFWSVNFFIIEEDTKPNCQRVSQCYQALAVDTVSQYKSHLCLNILTEKLIIHWTIVFFIYLYIIT